MSRLNMTRFSVCWISPRDGEMNWACIGKGSTKNEQEAHLYSTLASAEAKLVTLTREGMDMWYENVRIQTYRCEPIGYL